MLTWKGMRKRREDAQHFERKIKILSEPTMHWTILIKSGGYGAEYGLPSALGILFGRCAFTFVAGVALAPTGNVLMTPR